MQIKFDFYERIKKNEIIDSGELVIDADFEIVEGHYEYYVDGIKRYIPDSIKDLKINSAVFTSFDGIGSVNLDGQEVFNFVETYISEHIGNYI